MLAFFFFFWCGEFVLDIRLWLLSFFSFLSKEFPSQIQSCLHFYLGSFSYTSPAALIFTWGDSLRHPVLASFSCAEVLLHIPCWLLLLLFFFFFFFLFFLFLGNFTYTSLADFIFLWGVSLTHPVLASCFLLNLGSFSYTSGAGFIFLWGVSLTHPMLALFFRGEFFLHIPCCLLLFFIWGVSLTHPLLASALSREFLLHIPCWLYFLSGEFPLNIQYLLYVSMGSFSYTSHTGFFI